MRVLLDRFVSILTADAAPDGGDEHPGGGQEGQVPVELPGDHGRICPELVQNGEECSEQPVDGEEAFDRLREKNKDRRRS